MSIAYSLTIVKGDETGRTFKVDRVKAALGRHASHNDIVLNDPYISSTHARIFYNSGNFFLEDIDSTNKTFVNGVALIPNKPVMLSNGMEFTLGKTGFRFQSAPVQKPAVQSAPSMKKKSPRSENYFERMIHIFNTQKLPRLTPVLLGIALWAIVVIVFWIITMTKIP